MVKSVVHEVAVYLVTLVLPAPAGQVFMSKGSDE